MENQFRKPRRQFLSEFPICWFCGFQSATDVHEITRGPCRVLAYGERCAWGAACRDCNCFRLTDKNEWPIERQLAIKWIRDREHFDLEKINEIRRGIGLVSATDVAVWICRELN